MRAEVADSWMRSAAAGVRADTVESPITLPDAELNDYREAHPLAAVFPLLDDVLGQAARDCDAVMAVSDAGGQLLWVCGTPATLRKAERIGFVEGSNWDERLAGTNAPGVALRLNRSIEIKGREHFRRAVQPWSCAATPIHDPMNQSILGVLDITGGDEIVVPQTMAMVRAAARMAESELARAAATLGVNPHLQGSRHQISIDCLGRNEALVTLEGKRIRLSPRHSEILVLLAATPHGMSGDELAVMLYEEDSSDSTLRAELNRLRNLLGDDLLGSRPYRLLADAATDWRSVEARLAAGEVSNAVRRYAGPLLPRSVAPGIVRLRRSIAHSVRDAVIRSGSPDLMSTWTRSSWGADDYEMWLAQGRALGPGSPLLPLIRGQLSRLDDEAR